MYNMIYNKVFLTKHQPKFIKINSNSLAEWSETSYSQVCDHDTAVYAELHALKWEPFEMVTALSAAWTVLLITY